MKPPVLSVVPPGDLDVGSYDRPRFAVEWAQQVKFDPAGVEQLVEDTLTAGAASLWYGPPGCGKTTILADALFSLARGAEWLGKRTQRRPTLFLAAESPHSVRMRLEAYRRKRGEFSQFAILPATVNLLDARDVATLVETVLAENERMVVEAPIAVIAIDTVARVMVGGNDSDSEDMGRLVNAVDRVRQSTGAHVALIHHSGKDLERGARGHSSLLGAVDTEIEVSVDAGGIRTLEVTKQRDLGSVGMKLQCKLVPVELGRDQWDKPITSCIVEPVEPPSAHIAAVMERDTREHAEQVVRRGFDRLVEQGIRTTDGESSSDYLPKRLADKGLHDGIDRRELAQAMHRLMTAGVFKRGQIGTYSNRSPRFGLVLVEA